MTATTGPPLTARSVLASTLLGTDPPELPVSFLVRAGALFGFAEGTVRTALSRMVASGELSTTGGWYRLAGALVERQQRQNESRAALTSDWDGSWSTAVVTAGTRSASERAELRAAMTRRRYGELREGVWTRPTNLATSRAAVDEQCCWFRGEPVGEAWELVVRLWDLEGWSAHADRLCQDMSGLLGRLETDDPSALVPGFVLSAAVLRHFGSDPLLPDDLLLSDPRGSSWAGDRLRHDYDRYDHEFRRVLLLWVQSRDAGAAPTVEP